MCGFPWALIYTQYPICEARIEAPRSTVLSLPYDAQGPPCTGHLLCPILFRRLLPYIHPAHPPRRGETHDGDSHQQVEDRADALRVRKQQPLELRTPGGQQGPHRFRASACRERSRGAHRRCQDRDLPCQGLRKYGVADDVRNSRQQVLHEYQEGDRHWVLGWRDCVLY
jgi:hypothetical protein